MGKIVLKDPKSYKNINREDFGYRPIDERLKDYKTVYLEYTDDFIKAQASRCQDCGIPFCHGFGCPVMNMIPDWNDLVFKERWQEALNLLHSTNNFPEITGKVCPSPCEEACTLNVGMEPVTIRNIELAIIEKGFENGWVVPQPPTSRTGKSAAIIGSGPAGLVAAQNLNRQGHKVTVYEKDDKIGGFLRYGIPDFKLEKNYIDRRVSQLEAEGVEFITNVHVGDDIKVKVIKNSYNVILLSCGSRDSRDLPIEGRDLNGIHFAVDYLKQSNMRVAGVKIAQKDLIDAKGKNVVVIGGGDTGADCIGTSKRQGAKNVYQLEILPRPSNERAEDTPWPMYAKKFRSGSSHNEGCERKWNVMTKKFVGKDRVEGLVCVEVEWSKDDSGNWQMKEKQGSEFEIKADMVLLAMGFTHTVHDKLLEDLGVDFDNRGNIKTDHFGYGMTNIEGVFSAGDAARGASLIVHAFAHAGDVSKEIDKYLRKM